MKNIKELLNYDKNMQLFEGNNDALDNIVNQLLDNYDSYVRSNGNSRQAVHDWVAQFMSKFTKNDGRLLNNLCEWIEDEM